MTNMHIRLPKLKAQSVRCLAIGVLATVGAACASNPPPTVAVEKFAVPELEVFCAEAQRVLVNARVPIQNAVVTDYNAFVQAHPDVQPLTTQQFVVYRGVGQAQPQMISCKLKSADHIRASYGKGSAGEPASCAYINRRTLDGVMASLTKRERKKLMFNEGRAVLIEADHVASTLTQWLEPYRMVDTDVSNTLRIRAKSMRSDWNDPKFASAPARIKGTYHCHLIAPDYLKSLLLGAVKPNDDSLR
jgi:hypothetical protein